MIACLASVLGDEAQSYGALQLMEGIPQIFSQHWFLEEVVSSLCANSRKTLASRLCCRTCQHCSDRQTGSGWCLLRHLDVHCEVADLVVCHHWTARAPQLPALDREFAAEEDCQLELDRSLA